MSMRYGWTIDGKHFTCTSTERGGLRHFIDGKPTTKALWQASVCAARDAEKSNGTFIERGAT